MNAQRLLSKVLFIVLLLGLSLVLTSQSLAAPGTATNDPTAVVATGALNVRSGPGVSYGVVAVVYEGQPLALLGRNNSSSWVHVQVPNGPKGWVNASLLNTSYPIGSLPVMGAPGPAPQAYVTTGAANIRTGPGLAYNSIFIVYQNQFLGLLGRTSSGAWIKVHVPNGPEGWINESLIQMNVSLSSLPILGAPDPTPQGIVNTGALNVRSGPGVAYGIVTTLPQNQTMVLTGRNHNNSWVRIRVAGGVTGWVNASLIRTNVTISTLPVVGSPSPTPQAYVNTGALNVRQGPGVQYRAVAVIYQWQYVGLVGRTASGGWVQIHLSDGRTGWVNASYLQANVAISSLPVTG